MSVFNSVFNAIRNAVRNGIPPQFWPRGRATGTYTAPTPPSGPSGDGRLLEDGSFRLLESGDFRLLE